MSELAELHLSFNPIGPEGAKKLAEVSIILLKLQYFRTHEVCQGEAVGASEASPPVCRHPSRG